ncbi:MAG: ribosome small subunit-dependent GTPase A [Spirochaetota bacterium]
MEPLWSTIALDPHLERVQEQADGATIGRVVAQDGPLLFVVSPEGAGYSRPSGRLGYLMELGTEPVPAVGDYVELDGGTESPVRRVLPRRSVYERKEAGDRSRAQVICANVDVAFVVTTAPAATVRDETDRTSLHDFNVRRVERFIATLDPSVRPVVVINKCDLIEEHERVRTAIAAELPGTDVRMISALSGDGVDALRALVPAGSTAVLVGSSGSGKSTLIARLTGEELRAGAVRENDGRGRHTTTGRRTYAIEGGGLLVDTPGMREVQLWSDDTAAEQLGSAFPEVDRYAAECRFSDCRHQGEPGCAVQTAVQAGEITHDRYLAFLELQEEQNVAAARREKRDRLNDRRAARKARMKRRSRGS